MFQPVRSVVSMCHKVKRFKVATRPVLLFKEEYGDDWYQVNASDIVIALVQKPSRRSQVWVERYGPGIDVCEKNYWCMYCRFAPKCYLLYGLVLHLVVCYYHLTKYSLSRV